MGSRRFVPWEKLLAGIDLANTIFSSMPFGFEKCLWKMLINVSQETSLLQMILLILALYPNSIQILLERAADAIALGKASVYIS